MEDFGRRMEYTEPGDRYYDYCLWEYEPLALPAEKFRSVNLLYHTFEVGGLDGGAYDLVGAIREGVGLFRTVWGVKHLGQDRLAWEFYFYDYRRRQRTRSITRLLEVLSPFASSNLEPNENLPYFMFSIDIDGALVTGARDLDTVHVYMGNVGSTVSSGICYLMDAGGMRLENFYFFFDANKQHQEIIGKILCSACVDFTAVPLDRVFWPELRNCGVVVVANKQRNDAIYFSRINVDQLLFFLKRMNYPAALIDFVEENRPRLDHLLFDVGIDYRMEGGNLLFLKSGYYGVF